MGYYNGKKVLSVVSVVGVNADELIDGSITEIESNASVIKDYACAFCQLLKTADLKRATSIGENAFFKSYALDTLIIRSSSVATLYNIYSLGDTKLANGQGYIYVPRNLVSQYQNATNWGYYGSRFRPLEDYTIDGTTAGDLDPTKI